MFRRRRVFRILSIVLSICLIISLAAFAVIYFALPSLLARVAGTMENVRPPQVAVTPAPAPSPASTSNRAPASLAPARPAASDVVLNYLLNRYEGTTTSDIRVCTFLGGPATNAKTAEEWQATFNDFAARENRPDPLIESMLIPVGYFVRLPNVGMVLQQLRDTIETGDRTFLDQPDFPPMLSRASAETIRARNTLTLLSQRAYDLFTLSRTVQMNPDLANDARTLNLCALLTNAARRDLMGQPSLSISEEKQTVLNYLADIGLAPNQVRYDFNTLNEVSAVINERTVSLSSPWITRMIGTPFFIVALGNPLPANQTTR